MFNEHCSYRSIQIRYNFAIPSWLEFDCLSENVQHSILGTVHPAQTRGEAGEPGGNIDNPRGLQDCLREVFPDQHEELSPG